MNHHQLESALDHLEHVLARISGTDHIPLSYWRKRVDDVSAAARIPAQKNRARRLDEALSALGPDGCYLPESIASGRTINCTSAGKLHRFANA